MSEPIERISEADRMLIMRMEAEIQSAAKLQAFVSGHLAALYALTASDQVTPDGRIIRGETPQLDR